MEISGSLITAWQPPPANSRTAPESRTDEQESQAQRSTETSPLSEYISQGEVVQGKGAADYGEALSQARRGRDNSATGGQAWSAQSTQKTQQALEAYRSNTNSVENGSVELLPRVDSYA
jgi:hypothetical protein